MISFRDLVSAFRTAGLTPARPVVVHAALSAFGDEIHGGPASLVGALLASSAGVLVPTFTYATMLTPETGPSGNAISYGEGKDANRMAEFYTPQMPADRLMGLLPETLRRSNGARRSLHPILSFAGIGLDALIESQTLCEPLTPLGGLAERGGQVVLIGVDQRVNTSIHYAEARAGRKQFVRWALTSSGVRECPGFPGCSEGFNQAAPWLAPHTRCARAGEAQIMVIELGGLVEAVCARLAEDPLALLCGRADCSRCAAVRAAVSAA